MEELIKLIKDYRSTKNKKAYLMVLLEKSKKNNLPIYSLLQLLNSINKNSKIISSEGWIEKDIDLQQQRKIIEKEKAELKKAKTDFENSKKRNSYFKGILLVISIIVVGLFSFYYVIPNFKLKEEKEKVNEEEIWEKALMKNTMASYKDFMKQYPQSKYFQVAKNKSIILQYSNMEQNKKNNPLFNSSNISAMRTEKKISSTEYSNKDQEELKEKTDPGTDYQKALDYYYEAKEKFSLKDYKKALTFIDLALLYDSDNNKYINYKSNIEKSLIAHEDKSQNKKVNQNIKKRKGERYKNQTNTKSNQTPKINVVKSTKTENIVKKEVFKENVSFTVVDEVPVYPGCKGSNIEKKKCMQNKITKHFNKKYKIGFASDLGLSPGKKRIFVQFTIDKSGKTMKIKARGPHKRLEDEAIRVAHLLPSMIPGRQQGRIVNVKYTLPITVIVK